MPTRSRGRRPHRGEYATAQQAFSDLLTAADALNKAATVPDRIAALNQVNAVSTTYLNHAENEGVEVRDEFVAARARCKKALR
jgi:hypothetical protein